ncbi:hypothetical protein MSAN_00356600 [Mycena sanguinolenta]|uniref:Uncharacterized protein n=1 Tax=Mycena sanguinolenta TaxID=230812 RepID=A0A8H7DJL2_9AGAR|nr:hypothetical protein MSAN_00356600 [Mycena sanguinolenta]
MPPPPHTRLPELTVFMWSGVDEDGTSVFEGLSLPGLADLYLYGASEGSLQCLYKNSSFTLRVLRLSSVDIGFPFLSAFLRDMPSLVSFIASRLSESITDEFLVSLTYDKSHNRILPNLERFDIHHRVRQFFRVCGAVHAGVALENDTARKGQDIHRVPGRRAPTCVGKCAEWAHRTGGGRAQVGVRL